MAQQANVREIQSLQFKDGSTYRGQALMVGSQLVPYGYGVMLSDGFRIEGAWKQGKNFGFGQFTAKNGDVFYGYWNENHKRHGKGLFVRASDGIELVEEYEDGALLKRLKRRPPSLSTLFVLPCVPCTPRPRSGHSFTLVASLETAVLFGGELADGERTTATNELWLLDINKQTWTNPTLEGAPPALHSHTATLVGAHTLVILGGQLSVGLEMNSAVYVLDLRRGVWSCPVTKGMSFVGHSATLIGDAIYVIVQASLFVLDVKSWSWSNPNVTCHLPMSLPRSFMLHSAVEYRGKIVVFGGRWGGAGERERLCADIRVLDVNALSWSAPSIGAPAEHEKIDYSGFTAGKWSSPRSEHECIRVGNKLYIIGGWTCVNPQYNVVHQSYLGDIQVLDLELMQWLPAAPQLRTLLPRASHRAVFIESLQQLWLVGGRNCVGMIEAMDRINLPHEGASAAPAAKKKPAEATPSAAGTQASTSTSSNTTAASAKLPPASHSHHNSDEPPLPPLPPMPSSCSSSAAPTPPPFPSDDEPTDSEQLGDESVGTGSILDQFLKGQQ